MSRDYKSRFIRTDRESVEQYLERIALLTMSRWWREFNGRLAVKGWGITYVHMSQLCRAAHIAGCNVDCPCPVFPFESNKQNPTPIDRTRGDAYAWNQAWNVCRAWEDIDLKRATPKAKTSGAINLLLNSGLLNGKYNPTVVVNFVRREFADAA